MCGKCYGVKIGKFVYSYSELFYSEGGVAVDSFKSVSLLVLFVFFV